MNRVLTFAFLIAGSLGMARAACTPANKAGTATATIGGKAVTITYCAPSMKGRKIFNGAGALQPDNTVWRMGADSATSLHTDAALTFGSVNVPAGDYTLYIALDTGKWDLVISKQTGQWGINRDGSTSLDTAKEVGRVHLTMSKPSAPVELFKISLESTGGDKGKLDMAWENVAASTTFTAK
ncbi:MAG TPA: DUF2911 domain-containing protein [Candidatus Sulfopaludibacter sp.]|jgi:hypothetical protein|nr:DUF2911 domain-containing protein [Candidatus Sulfopaludibacter sp.]